MKRGTEIFWQLLQDSVLIQSIITLMLLSSVCYLVIVEHPVPDLIQQLTWVIIGFWFGSKSVQAANRSATNMVEATRALSAAGGCNDGTQNGRSR